MWKKSFDTLLWLVFVLEPALESDFMMRGDQQQPNDDEPEEEVEEEHNDAPEEEEMWKKIVGYCVVVGVCFGAGIGVCYLSKMMRGREDEEEDNDDGPREEDNDGGPEEEDNDDGGTGAQQAQPPKKALAEFITQGEGTDDAN
ncbi:hypothetical protein niasHT_026194 [Heterodera trifolii]|uniref:Uncharacterized protein n=1 Tax=Heterodera trifolii TaxID=157864 RepID=A0ABD2K1T6_9BILA